MRTRWLYRLLPLSVVNLRGVRLDISSPKIAPAIKYGIRRGWYEIDELESIVSLVDDGDTILEVGAGCGFVSAYLARQFPASRIITVEADPELMPIIERNHQLNGVHVEVVNEVLGTGAGEATFHVQEEYWTSKLAGHDDSPATGARSIVVRQSDFIERLHLWQPRALIIDIEGGELNLLTRELPPFVTTVVLECHEEAYGLAGVKRLMDNMSAMGFAYVPGSSRRNVLAYRRLAGGGS
ncbi:FkbM family methyltransferase [soil metagenome]